jgi:hypothetical protein
MRLSTALQASLICISVYGFAASTCAVDSGTADAAIPRDKLAAACRAAKAEFHPIGKPDAAQAKTVLLEAAERLDQRLTQDGPNGEAWREYLLWGKMQEALRGEKDPDLSLLTRIYGRYTAGYEGLELVWFLDVRYALHNYIATSNALNDHTLRARSEQILDKLADSIDAYLAKPTTETALVISESVRWLQNAHQAPQLVKAIQLHLAMPNVIGEASSGLVAAGIIESVDEVTQITDCIMGTSIFGTAHTVGKTNAALAPNSDVGVLDTLFFGTANSCNVGYHGPVTIFSSSSSSLAACKRMWITEEGLFAHPAVSNAETSICINDIQSRKGRRFIERAAWKRAGKQQACAEYIASRHAEQRLNERIDEQAAESLEKANHDYAKKYHEPFGERKLLPELMHFSSTERAICFVGLQAGGGKVGAPGMPPPVVEGADMTLRLHESAVNNLAFDAVAGRTVHEEKMQSAVTNALGHLPEKMKGDEDGKPWAITFAPRKPIVVAFADDGFKVTLRGVRYYKGGDRHPAMNVSASYKIEQSPQGFKAVRQGPIEVIPPDFVPGSGQRLDAKRTIIRNLLRHRFAKVFEPEFVSKGIEFKGKWKAAGKLMPIQVVSRDGWLVIAWKRAASEPKPAPVK